MWLMLAKRSIVGQIRKVNACRKGQLSAAVRVSLELNLYFSFKCTCTQAHSLSHTEDTTVLAAMLKGFSRVLQLYALPGIKTASLIHGNTIKTYKLLHVASELEALNFFNASCSKLVLFEGFSAILV